MKRHHFIYFFLISCTILNNSTLKANEEELDGIKFVPVQSRIQKIDQSIVVTGLDKDAHYQLMSKPVKVAPKYTIHFDLEVGNNSTRVGVGILNGNRDTWVVNPIDHTFDQGLYLNKTIVLENNLEQFATLVFTNQDKPKALANFTVKSVKFENPVTNTFLGHEGESEKVSEYWNKKKDKLKEGSKDIKKGLKTMF